MGFICFQRLFSLIASHLQIIVNFQGPGILLPKGHAAIAVQGPRSDGFRPFNAGSGEGWCMWEGHDHDHDHNNNNNNNNS